MWQIILKNETALSGMDEGAVLAELGKRLDVMRKSASRALFEGLPTVGGLITGMAHTQWRYAENGGILGAPLNRAMARALSGSETNAAMGKICAVPTAGACGVVPAVLLAMEEQYGLSERATLEGLLTATGVGAVIMKNATVSGAEAGCQAECGAAAAMAGAAAVQMAGGAPAQSAHACAFALMNCMGLICDPVAGLVQLPCALRNASQAVNALLSADLALAGQESLIPADEVIDAMHRVGKLLPVQLRETAMGGIAATPTGKALIDRILKKD